MVWVAVVVLPWSRRSTPTASHDIWGLLGQREASQQLSSPGQPSRKPTDRTARRRQASGRCFRWCHRQGLPLRSTRLAPATFAGLGPSLL